jgi:hypothetical protein
MNSPTPFYFPALYSQTNFGTGISHSSWSSSTAHDIMNTRAGLKTPTIGTTAYFEKPVTDTAACLQNPNHMPYSMFAKS